MRTAAVAAVVLVFVVGLALADLSAPSWTSVGRGSVGVEPATDLVLLPPEPGCEDTADDDDCDPRFAFAPDRSIVAWASVRNEGPAPVVLEGVAADWFDRPELMIVRPVRVLDGGDPLDPAGWHPTQTAWQPLGLAPGEQRMVGIVFHTSGDLAAMCRHYMDGGGIGFGSAPMRWRVAVATHVYELPVPFFVIAPTTAECT